MAKTDTAIDPASEIQQIIKDGRKRPMNFALLKTKEGVILKAHALKSSDVMFREAKQAGGQPAIAITGVLNVTGKLLSLTSLAEDVPRNLPKLAKKYFASLGAPIKVQVTLPGGGCLDDEAEDEMETETVAPGIEAPVEAEDDGARAAMAARLADVKRHVEEAVPVLGDNAAPLSDALDAVRKLVDDGKTDEAESALDEVEEALQTALDAAKTGVDDGLRTQLQTEFDALQSGLDRVRSAAGEAVVRKADQISSMFQTELEGNLKKASGVLSVLAKFISTETARLPSAGDDVKSTPEEDAAGQSLPNGASGGDAVSSSLSPDVAPVIPDSSQACFDEMSSTFGDFWDQVCVAAPRDDAALEAELGAITNQRAEIERLFAEGPIDVPRAIAIGQAIMRLGNLVTTAKKINEIQASNPEAATHMREAMTGFDAELGPGTVVTPELLAQIEAERQAALTAQQQAEVHLAAAEAMPAGRAREAAITAAQEEIETTGAALEACKRKQTAAKGKEGLTVAITSGPLAADAGHPFDDLTAAQFVDAFRREPELATSAIETASTSQHPEAIASGMGMLCDRMEDGFATSDGRTPPAGFDKGAYARNLIAGAGAEGGDYMADAGDYIASGAHLTPDPIPSPPGANTDRLARDRSNYMALSVVDAAGQIDVDTPNAKTALGHLRFSPDVIDTPTPDMNQHVIGMCETLGDPNNQQEAQGILDGIGPPEPGAQTLLSRAIGKPPGDVTEDDARQQVMASMMTPVHQGPVGSCFATAGVRRMNELDPMESMERYAELAETGQFQPRNGMDAIPAVMSFPADQDPLIRSMEYSAATVMAEMDENSRNQLMNHAWGEAVDNLAGPVGDLPEWLSRGGADNWKVDKMLIRQTVVSSFRIEYDATRSTTPSADGSSSAGVYMLMQFQPVNKAIDSEADFVAALTERVLTALGERPGSDKANDISAAIASRSYLDALFKGGHAPWDMGGGGQPAEADAVLFGQEAANTEITDNRTGWDTLFGQTEGARGEELLAGLLTQIGEGGPDLVPVMNNGIHAFNALPNDPSMQALRDGGDIPGKIRRQLVEPGQQIAATTLTDEKAIEIMREFFISLRHWDSAGSRAGLINTAEQQGPGGAVAPPALKTRIISVCSAYLDALALQQANLWVSNEAAAGTVHTNAERDTKAATLRSSFSKALEGMASAAAVREIATPSVTIADSNWGDAAGKTLFVMAPDPMSGQLIMWSQSLPSGSMTPLGEKWVDAGWSEVRVK